MPTRRRSGRHYVLVSDRATSSHFLCFLEPEGASHRVSASPALSLHTLYACIQNRRLRAPATAAVTPAPAPMGSVASDEVLLACSRSPGARPRRGYIHVEKNASHRVGGRGGRGSGSGLVAALQAQTAARLCGREWQTRGYPGRHRREIRRSAQECRRE